MRDVDDISHGNVFIITKVSNLLHFKSFKKLHGTERILRLLRVRLLKLRLFSDILFPSFFKSKHVTGSQPQEELSNLKILACQNSTKLNRTF